MKSYEEQYMEALKDIYDNGYADGTNERTGRATKRLPNQIICVDVEKEFPILQSKKVFAKTAMREILWIWQAQSNNIHDLNAHIWDDWANESGSIGKSYGYQMANRVRINVGKHDKPDYREYASQTHFVLEYLKEFPMGRWAHTTLWKTDDLDSMNLCPCVHTTDWNLDGGRLNLNLTQRSGDIPYGVPFNTTQYAMLMCMFARHLGVKPGILLHTISDAHIYDNQMEGVEKQFKNYNAMMDARHGMNIVDMKLMHGEETAARAWEILNAPAPQFIIGENIKSFWYMGENNMGIEDYISFDKIDFGDIVV